MNKRVSHIALFSGIISLLFSCKDHPSNNHGPIVLGDTSTIVTENDPQRLKDLVVDLQPVIPPPSENDSAGKAPAAIDTLKKAKPAIPAEQPLPDVAGLKAEFKEVTVLIPGVNAKQAGRADLQRANGAVYTFVSGNINGSTIRVTGNITRVLQRYQTTVVLKNEMGTMAIDPLSTTTGWEALKGSNNQFKITDLDQKSLDYPEVSAAGIRNAVMKAAKRHRYSRRKVEEWVYSVRRVRSVNQKPMYVMLRSVMWKIDGKDANGRMFSKQIRIDMPL